MEKKAILFGIIGAILLLAAVAVTAHGPKHPVCSWVKTCACPSGYEQSLPANVCVKATYTYGTCPEGMVWHSAEITPGSGNYGLQCSEVGYVPERTYVDTACPSGTEHLLNGLCMTLSFKNKKCTSSRVCTRK